MLPNIGFSELLVIFLVVLLLFGAKRLPDIGQALGKSIREFKKAVQGLSGEDKNEDPEKKN